MAKRGQAISKKYAALLLALVLLLASAIGGALWIILSENKISSSKYDKQELFFDFSGSAIFYGEQFANKSGNNQSISGVPAYIKEEEIVNGGGTKDVYKFVDLSVIGGVSFNVPQTTQHTATGTYSQSRPSLGEGNAYANADTLLTTVGDKITVNLSGEAAGLYYVPDGGFTVPMKAVVYQGSIKDASVYYTRIEDALEVGAASATSQKFYVLPLKEKGFAPTITENCTVAAGDSLVLKIDEVERYDGSKSVEGPVDITDDAPDAAAVTVTGNNRNDGYRKKSGIYIGPDKNSEGDFIEHGGEQIFADSLPDQYFKNEVIIDTNATVTIENGATLFVAGVTGVSSIGMQGFTSGDYAQISMKSGAKINCKEGGVLDCLGFIKESGSKNNGSQIINNGTVYSPFVFYDYRGGKATVGAYLGNKQFNVLSANNMAKNPEGIFPISIFDMPNIQSKIITDGNKASIKGYADLFTGSISALGITLPAQHNLVVVDIIAHDSGMIKLQNGAKAVTKFTGKSITETVGAGADAGRTTDGTTTIDLYGSASLGVTAMNVTVAIINANVSSDKVFLPISWKFDITLNDIECFERDTIPNYNGSAPDYNDGDSVYNVGNQVKFLSGASLTVNQGAALNVSSEAIFFPRSIGKNEAVPSGETEASIYRDTTPEGSGLPGKNYPAKAAATLTVNGELSVTADGVVGGKVLTGQQGAKLNIEGSVFEVTSEEGYGKFEGTLNITTTLGIVDTITQNTNIDVYNGTGVDLSKPLDAPGTYYSVQVSGSNYAWLPAFSVTLNANGGAFGDGATTKIIEAKAGVTVSTQEKPTREHYHFTHWCTNASCENDANCADRKEGVLYADATLYAIWEENVYTLYRQDVVEGEITGNRSEICKFTINTNAIALEQPTLGEYTFNYWRVGASEDSAIIQSVNMAEYLNKAFANGGEEGSVTIYAHWVEAAVYTIDFNTTIDNADQDYSHANVSVVDRADVTYNAPTASTSGKGYGSQDNDITYQYAWGGWYIDQDLTIPYANWAQLRDGAAPDGEETFKRTLYAKWIKKHTVIIDINAGASGNAAPEAENATVYLVDGQSYTLPAGLESKNQILTVTHYFAGWQLSDQSLGQLSGEAGVSSLSLTATGDITVTAVWKLKHELSFVTSYPEDINTNEHIIEVMPPIYLLSGQSHDISQYNGKVTANDSNTAIKYYFGNWRKNGVDGEVHASSTVVFADGEQDLELYAYWLNKTEIVFATGFNEGAIGVESISIASVYYKEGTHELAQYQQVMTKYNSDERANQYFRGWAFSNNAAEIIAQVEVADNGGLGGQIELVAIWETKKAIEFNTEAGSTNYPISIETIYLLADSTYDLSLQKETISKYNNDTRVNKYFVDWTLEGGEIPDNNVLTVTEDIKLIANFDLKVEVQIEISVEEGDANGRDDAFYKLTLTDSAEIKYGHYREGRKIEAGTQEDIGNRTNTIQLKLYVISGHTLTLVTSAEDGSDNTVVDGEKIDSDNNNFEVPAYWQRQQTCIVEGTLVTLADGTKKVVDDLTYADRVLVFNHETGKMEAGYIAMLDHLDFEREWRNVINLEFSDGSVLRIVFNHGLYNLTLNKYVFIHEGNYGEYVGNSFYSAVYENGAFVGRSVTLVKSYITYEFIKVYNPTTVTHVNYFASNMLNVTALPSDVLDCWHVNIFDYDSDMKYDEAKKQADIEKYGLYTYEDFKEYLTYEQFNALPFEYLKVAVGKGRLTWQDILDLIEYFKRNNLI